MKDQLFTVLQARLKQLGFYKGAIDGLEGVMTANAVIEFKRHHHLTARDYVGPLTVKVLFSDSAKKAPKPKRVKGERLALSEAKRMMGVKETPGAGNTETIMDWARDLDQWYPGDDTPWCGLFVAHCEQVGAPYEPQDFNRLGARAWLNYGEECPPAVGAIAVFWRTHPTRSGNGHVGYIVGEDRTTFHILGGNQSDKVCITRIAKNRLLGCRIPAGENVSTIQLASVTTGELSTNEA